MYAGTGRSSVPPESLSSARTESTIERRSHRRHRHPNRQPEATATQDPIFITLPAADAGHFSLTREEIAAHVINAVLAELAWLTISHRCCGDRQRRRRGRRARHGRSACTERPFSAVASQWPQRAGRRCAQFDQSHGTVRGRRRHPHRAGEPRADRQAAPSRRTGPFSATNTPFRNRRCWSDVTGSPPLLVERVRPRGILRTLQPTRCPTASDTIA